MTRIPEHQNHQKLDGPLEIAVWGVLNTSVPGDAIERVKQAARVTARSTPAIAETLSDRRRLDSSHSRSRGLLMKTFLASAVVVVVATVALLLPNEFSSHSYAYADALKLLKAARTMTYTHLVYVATEPEPIKIKEFYAEDGRHRSEHESDVISIYDADSMIRLTLIGSSKTALVNPPMIVESPLLKHSQRDWIESLAKLSDKPDKELGEKLLDGRSVVGFESSQGPTKFRFWLDAKSKEIVRLELDHPIKGDRVLKSAMTAFRFDELLDESLFSLEVPAGYEVTELNPQVMEELLDGEANIVEALRCYTKQADGKFPKSLSNWAEWCELFAKGSTTGKLSPDAAKMAGHLGAILPFLTGLPKNDYDYLGDGKTTAETKAIIFWYKNEASVYRAIYGDLSVKSVTKDQLPAPTQK